MKRYPSSQIRPQQNALVPSGVALISFGVLGLCIALEIVSIHPALNGHTSILNSAGDQFIDDFLVPLRVGAITLGIMFLALGLSWLRLQLPARRKQDDLKFEMGDNQTRSVDQVGGVTVVPGNVLAAAFEHDLESLPGIERARAELRIEDEAVRIRLDVDDDAELRKIREAVLEPALDRLRLVAGFANSVKVLTDIRLVSTNESR